MTGSLAHVEKHLCEYAELDQFWILKTNHIQPGLIHYLDSQGAAFTLMDDDDDRVEQCLELLESRGCPVFDDVIEMDKYAAELARQKRG